MTKFSPKDPFYNPETDYPHPKLPEYEPSQGVDASQDNPRSSKLNNTIHNTRDDIGGVEDIDNSVMFPQLPQESLLNPQQFSSIQTRDMLQQLSLLSTNNNNNNNNNNNISRSFNNPVLNDLYSKEIDANVIAGIIVSNGVSLEKEAVFLHQELEYRYPEKLSTVKRIGFLSTLQEHGIKFLGVGNQE